LKHLAFAATLALVACMPAAEAPAAPAEAQSATSGEASVLSGDVTTAGWAALRIGMTKAEVVAAAGDREDPNSSGGPQPELCDEFHPSRAPDGLYVMLENGKLSRITLAELSTQKTSDGFGIGDDPAAIKAFYGARATASPHQYQDKPAEYITVWQTPPARDFDPAARGFVYEVDSTGKVGAIHAGGASIQYVEGCL
jgi:hypothetical protein